MTQHGSRAATVPSFPVLPPGTPFAANSIWNTPLPANAPIDANSAAYTNSIVRQVATYYGNAALNTDAWTSNMYVVGPDQPLVTIKFDNCQNKPNNGSNFLNQINPIPIPEGAVPAVGTDGAMTIYQPSTDTEWEMWKAQKRPDGWYACWGGKLVGVSSNIGMFPWPYGPTATGLPLLGAQIRVSEFYAGEIKHAIGLAITERRDRTYFSWPATRSDGSSPSPDTIPEGTRLRLDPTLNVDSLSLHPVAKMIAKAAQTYGFILVDGSKGVSMRAEDPTQYINAGLGNPYTSTSTINGVTRPPIFGSTPPYLVLKDFPWNRIQAVSCDYGKPAGVASHCPPAPVTPPPPPPIGGGTTTPPAPGGTSGGETAPPPSGSTGTGANTGSKSNSAQVKGVIKLSKNGDISRVLLDGKPVNGTSIDTSKLSDGKHVITYVDKNNNQKSDTITVDNQQGLIGDFIIWAKNHTLLTALSVAALLMAVVELIVWPEIITNSWHLVKRLVRVGGRPMPPGGGLPPQIIHPPGG